VISQTGQKNGCLYRIGNGIGSERIVVDTEVSRVFRAGCGAVNFPINCFIF